MSWVSSPPRVTVIVATYNRSEVLRYAIASVLGQSFGAWELLVVGDGCTDDSQSVVEAVDDTRVRWIGLATNSGHQSAPNNEGIRQARGDYIAYLGHDDLWLPHHLSSLAAAMEDADIAYGLIRYVDQSGAWDPVFAHPAYVRGIWLPPTSVMHRRSLVQQVGGWRDYRTLRQDPDTDLWQRMHEGGARFALVPRLTSIKFPSSSRRDVYRDRPQHEQAEWLAKIQQDDSLEARELGTAFCATRPIKRLRYNELARGFLSETVRRTRLRIVGWLPRPPRDPGVSLEQTRLFRGLAPALDGRSRDAHWKTSDHDRAAAGLTVGRPGSGDHR